MSRNESLGSKLEEIAAEQKRHVSREAATDRGHTKEDMETFLQVFESLGERVFHKVGSPSHETTTAYREAAGEQWDYAKNRSKMGRRRFLRNTLGAMVAAGAAAAGGPLVVDHTIAQIRADDEQKARAKAVEQAELKRKKEELEGNRTIGLSTTHTTLNGWAFRYAAVDPRAKYEIGLLAAEITEGKKLGFPQSQITKDLEVRLSPYENSKGNIVPQLNIITARPDNDSSKEVREAWVMRDPNDPDPRIDKGVLIAENTKDPALRSVKIYISIALGNNRGTTFNAKNLERSSD